MRPFVKHTLPALLLAATMISNGLVSIAAPTAAVKKHSTTPVAAVKAKEATNTENYLQIEPLSLVQSPSQYLNKKVTFDATFSSFSSLGLDYKKAMRDSKDFVSMLIRRPDVTHHTIPLAELKLIYPRKKSEDVMHLESGDKIRVKGQVFSSALHDPWVDVSEVKILSAKNKPVEKKADKPDADKP